MHWLTSCFSGTRSAAARSSLQVPADASLQSKNEQPSTQLMGGQASDEDAVIRITIPSSHDAPFPQASLLSAILTDIPSIVTIVEADWLEASTFADPAITHSPLYQTKLSSDYYDQAIGLQGAKLTVRQLIAHLLDQHPNGLTQALAEMHEAISNGRQWKFVCCVKVPAAMEASSPDPPAAYAPLQMAPEHKMPDSLFIPFISSVGLVGKSSESLAGNNNLPLMRTMSLLQKIGTNTRDKAHQSSVGTPSKQASNNPIEDKMKSSPQFDIESALAEEIGLPLEFVVPVIHNVWEEGGEEARMEPDQAFMWHEVLAKPFVDPINGKKLVIIQQNDISVHVEQVSQLLSELRLSTECSSLSERQLACLSSTFPLHILEHLMRPAPLWALGFNKLARSHQDVTILFMVSDSRSISRSGRSNSFLISLRILLVSRQCPKKSPQNQ